MGNPLPPNYTPSLELIMEKMTANYTTNEILIELSGPWKGFVKQIICCTVLSISHTFLLTVNMGIHKIWLKKFKVAAHVQHAYLIFSSYGMQTKYWPHCIYSMEEMGLEE